MHLNEFFKDLDKANEARVAAGISAVKAEGYRLWKLMRAEIAAGAPGGSAFEPLREISQWSGRRTPLKGLSRAVRYKKTGSGLNFRMEIGAVDSRAERRDTSGVDALGGMGREWADKGLSNAWVTIFSRQQAGFQTSVPADLRAFYAGIGGALLKKKGAMAGWARFFFLRKETTQFTTPARDIVDTFWRSQQGSLQGNLSAYFAKKLAGEKI
jgi:hypothetical protein